jgi:hypothetical protein
MKKNFILLEPGTHPDRRVEAVKNELRKYLRRENRRALPDGVDYWDFDCRFGRTADVAEPIKPGEVIKGVDRARSEGWESFYMEILSKPVTRPKPVKEEKRDPTSRETPEG